jgi:hypothetical protein
MTDAPSSPDALRVAFLTARDSDPNYHAYREINEGIAAALRDCGATVRFLTTADETDADGDDVLLCLGVAPYHPTFMPALRRLDDRGAARPFLCLWHIENVLEPDTPLPTRAAVLTRDWLTYRRTGAYPFTRGGSYLLLKHLARRGLIDRLFLFTRHKAEFLTAAGIAAEYLPLGHHRVWGEDRGGERDIDVLYIGMLHGRREEIVHAVREKLAAAGVRLMTNYDLTPEGSIWGEARNAAVNRARLFLCVYRYPGDFSGMRFSLGMGNGAVIVSEPVADPHPFVPGTHFVECPVERLADRILELLGDPAEQERLRRAAADLLEREYSLKQSAERILTLAREWRLRKGNRPGL